MPDVSTTDAVAAGGTFALVWQGIKWATRFIAGRLDKRERELNERELRLDAQEAELVASLKGRLEVVEREIESLRIAVGIMVAKVAREDPAAPELKQVERILGTAFPMRLDMPPDMGAALGKLD